MSRTVNELWNDTARFIGQSRGRSERNAPNGSRETAAPEPEPMTLAPGNVSFRTTPELDRMRGLSSPTLQQQMLQETGRSMSRSADARFIREALERRDSDDGEYTASGTPWTYSTDRAGRTRAHRREDVMRVETPGESPIIRDGMEESSRTNRSELVAMLCREATPEELEIYLNMIDQAITSRGTYGNEHK